jgi:hypothetical protein
MHFPDDVDGLGIDGDGLVLAPVARMIQLIFSNACGSYWPFFL